jgi:hypothetical protein
VIGEAQAAISGHRNTIDDAWNAIVNVANVTSNSRRAISGRGKVINGVWRVIREAGNTIRALPTAILSHT